MKKKFQLGNVLTISFAHHIHDIYSSFLAPSLPLLIEKLGLSYTMAGLLNVFRELPALLNPLIGYLGDKLPIRYLLIFAPSLTAVSMSLLGQANSFGLLIVLLISAGVGASLFHVPAPVMIRKVAGNRIGKGMSFFMFGGELARSTGPMIVLAAISYWGFEGIYKLMPLGLISSAILFVKFRKIPISNAFVNKSKEESPLEAIKLHAPTFIKIAGIIFFMALVKGSLTTFLPTYLTASKGESIWFGGISLSIVQLAGAVGTFTSGTISDKIGRRNTLFIIAGTVPVLMFAFINTNEFFQIPLLLLIGFFMIASTPVLLAIINDIDSEHMSLINGIFMTLNFLVSGLAITLIGVLGDNLGLDTTYVIAPILGLLALPFIWKLKK
jgi:FSR family fosmidomycin resistance protein-like MFS transporter